MISLHSTDAFSPGNHGDIPLYIQLVGIAHDPVCEVFHQFVPEFHLLSEGQIVSSMHHGLHKLTHLCLDLYCMDVVVKVTHIPETLRVVEL